MDAAVASLLLCSVPDQARTLAELCRVLRPDGELPVLGHPCWTTSASARPEATRAEVEAAARTVGSDQVIAGLPDGYDTQVGERGALPAAGERQLVAFARADQIAVVSDGRIVESGAPADPRARGGRYADLYSRWLAGAA
jgi:ABC-type transport system involved in Fe-S cluster assembly fused permease/ATPase subunit